jgi:hypothetical protein
MNCLDTAWKQHAAELRSWLCHRTGQPQDVDDMMQDQYMKALRQGSWSVSTILTGGGGGNFYLSGCLDASCVQTSTGTARHAAVRVEAHDRKRLEQLCRYITRRALSDERVQLNAAGQVHLKLEAPWRDGTTHLIMSPLGLMQRLAPATALRRSNLGTRMPGWGRLLAHTNGR